MNSPSQGFRLLYFLAIRPDLKACGGASVEHAGTGPFGIPYGWGVGV